MKWIVVLAMLPAIVWADYGSVRVDEVVRVYDGDTITVNVGEWPALLGHEIGVRVNGIDTPEIRGRCESEKALAYEARDLVRRILATARDIELRNLDRGKYFRVVADVYVDGQNLASHVLAAKLAYPYDGGTKQGWCGA
ncbi:thermonuclease family protein [Marinobacter bohaiensis]|uniref:thermonuclease family protein n=1 Tax=Marinobacter bohaiensis TaxID=2201898 RepID=UPI001D175D51|nr:thermonuclease family protein [Marinobacter bohaiensis]